MIQAEKSMNVEDHVQVVVGSPRHDIDGGATEAAVSVKATVRFHVADGNGITRHPVNAATKVNEIPIGRIISWVRVRVLHK